MPEQHPAVTEVLQHFEYRHLPPHLRLVSQPVHAIAHQMAATLTGPQLTNGLNRLLEAKDCFVRAAVAAANRPLGPDRPEYRDVTGEQRDPWTTETGVTFEQP